MEIPIQKIEIVIRKMETPIQKMDKPIQYWSCQVEKQVCLWYPWTSKLATNISQQRLFLPNQSRNYQIIEKLDISNYDFVRFLLSDRIYLWALALDRAHLYLRPHRPGGPSACVVLYWPIIIILYMIIIYWLIDIILYSHHSIWSSYIGQA